jgi:D-alanine-D-alanine ligase
VAFFSVGMPAYCAQEIFPANLNSDQTHTIQQNGLKAHRALKLQDYSRIDFRMNPDSTIRCLEANPLPGLTANSLLPQSAATVGIAFPPLCEILCQLAVRRHSNRTHQ